MRHLQLAGLGPAPLLRQLEPLLQEVYLRIALEDLETGVKQVDPVIYGFELGCLVDDVHRRGDLPAIVEQPGDLELIPVPVAHGEVVERSYLRLVDRLRKHHRQRRHPLAVPTGIRRLLVDRRIHEIDERFKQLL